MKNFIQKVKDYVNYPLSSKNQLVQEYLEKLKNIEIAAINELKILEKTIRNDEKLNEKEIDALLQQIAFLGWFSVERL